MPPTMAQIHDWNVQFMDESREIASEYRGGLAKYGAPEENDSPYNVENGILFDFAGVVPQPHQGPHQPLPPIHGMLPDPYIDDQLPIGQNHDRQQREPTHRYDHPHPDSAYLSSNVQNTTVISPPYSQPEHSVSSDNRDYVRDPKELYYMQAFVEEVGLWMDCMDANKHVS
jgi:hypothetical protein